MDADFFNILVALGSISIFTRMAPAIEKIIYRNERSLKACENMLASISLFENKQNSNSDLISNFEASLDQAQNNITEKGESEAIKQIRDNYKQAFEGSFSQKKTTVSKIRTLAAINRQAMEQADLNAKQLGYAGAWSIVFMASCFFFTGLLFQKKLSRNLIYPLEEIYSVIDENLKENNYRRCTGKNLPKDIRQIFNKINEYIDKHNQL
jgi:hypothetical protein